MFTYSNLIKFIYNILTLNTKRENNLNKESKKVEALENHESESSKTTIPWDQTKVDQLNDFSDSDLIATLKGIKTEEQDLLRERERLQATQTGLRNQAVTQIDEKKKALKGLKSEIAVLQNKCNELEQAIANLIIPIYK